MTNDANTEVVNELRKISRILILTITKDQSQKEQIKLLTAIGLPPKEIAATLGTTRNTVSVILNKIGKEKGSFKKQRKGAKDE